MKTTMVSNIPPMMFRCTLIRLMYGEVPYTGTCSFSVLQGTCSSAFPTRASVSFTVTCPPSAIAFSFRTSPFPLFRNDNATVSSPIWMVSSDVPGLREAPSSICHRRTVPSFDFFLLTAERRIRSNMTHSFQIDSLVKRALLERSLDGCCLILSSKCRYALRDDFYM